MRVTECDVENCARDGRIVRGLCRAHYDYMRAHGQADMPSVLKDRRQVHKLTDVDELRQIATCAGCGPDSAVVYRIGRGRGYWACQNGSWKGGRKTPETRRAYAIPTKFGISVVEYDALLAKQSGVCAICSQVCSTGNHLAVDHDHNTGRIRGLLCSRCNRAIGLLGDDLARLQQAIAYLR